MFVGKKVIVKNSLLLVTLLFSLVTFWVYLATVAAVIYYHMKPFVYEIWSLGAVVFCSETLSLCESLMAPQRSGSVY